MKTKILKIVSICLILILSFSVFVSATFEITPFRVYVDSVVPSNYVYQITMNGQFTSSLNDIPYVYIQPKIDGELNFNMYAVLSKTKYFKQRQPRIYLEIFQPTTGDWVLVSDNSNFAGFNSYYDWNTLSFDTLGPYNYIEKNDNYSTFSFRHIVESGNTYRFKIEDMFLPQATPETEGYSLYSGRYLLEVYQICETSDLNFLDSASSYLSSLTTNVDSFYDKDGIKINATSIDTDKKEITYQSSSGQAVTKPFTNLSFDEEKGEITTFHPDNTFTSIVFDKANNSTTITETDMSTNTTIINNYYATPPTTPNPDGGGGNTGGSIWDRFLNAVADIVGKLVEFLGTLVTGVIEGFVGLLDNVLALFEKIIGFGDGLVDILKQLLSWIPSEIITVFCLGVSLMFLSAILKFFIKK